MPKGFQVPKMVGKDKTAEGIEQVKLEFLTPRVVPLRQSNEEEIARLLLRICQEAVQRIASWVRNLESTCACGKRVTFCTFCTA